MEKFSPLLILCVLFVCACSPSPIKNTDSSVKIVDESLAHADLLKNGTFKVSEFDYDSGPLNDFDVLGDSAKRIETDIRGRLYLPVGKGPFPVIIFLHGNHATCGFSTGPGNPRLDISVDFTTSGRCPAGYVEVPSYRGYDASARQLASWGYAVTSINANRGITGRNSEDSFDSSLIYARGNLVLRHIEELFKWSRDGRSNLLQVDGLDLFGKLDFSKVGMMGHSRGGEGVRYAYNIYKEGATSTKWKTRIPGLKFRGIFEIGPVDVGTDSGRTKVEAQGVAWNVLIPGCDLDVSDFSGVNPFERMKINGSDGFPKSIFTLWGANHNFFNTEWQVSDAPHACIGEQKPLWNVNAAPLPTEFQDIDAVARAGLKGSDIQIKFEKALMLAFFHSHLGNGDALKWDHVFDPQYRLPSALSSLASSSREYLNLVKSKSLFDSAVIETIPPTLLAANTLKIDTLENHLQKQLGLLEEGLNEYGKTVSGDRYQAIFTEGSFVRPAIVIEGEESSIARTAYLPFQKVESTLGYWTVDVALATRKGCYVYNANFELSCPPSSTDDSFDVALVLADGSVTSSVNIQNYVKLDNWYDSYFQNQGGMAQSDHIKMYFGYVPVLYQTARFELSDFGVTNQPIKGLQLTFSTGRDVSLVVDSILLSKRP